MGVKTPTAIVSLIHSYTHTHTDAYTVWLYSDCCPNVAFSDQILASAIRPASIEDVQSGREVSGAPLLIDRLV